MAVTDAFELEPVNRGITHWKSNSAGPGSGIVARVESTNVITYNVRLDKDLTPASGSGS
jgi:hypothetical protein